MSFFSLSLFVIGILIFFGYLGYNLYQKYNKREIHTCPKCESKDVIELGHETLDTHTVVEGNQIGVNVRLQLELLLNLRCKACGNKFQERVKRTY